MNREENLYNIKDEFEKVKQVTKNAINKYPDRKEEILMDFANMCLRSEIADVSDIIILFSNNGIREEELYNKFHLTNVGMCKR